MDPHFPYRRGRIGAWAGFRAAAITACEHSPAQHEYPPPPSSWVEALDVDNHPETGAVVYVFGEME